MSDDVEFATSTFSRSDENFLLSQIWPVSRALCSGRFQGSLDIEQDFDGLVRFRARGPARITLEPKMTATFEASEQGASVRLDESGGFGAWPTRAAMRSDSSLDFRLEDGDELFFQAMPARRPDPRRFALRVAHEGRPRPLPEGPHPSDAALTEAAAHADLIALHAYHWKGLSLAERRRAGGPWWRRCSWMTARHEAEWPDRFARVKETVRSLGRPLVVYVSPRYSRAEDLAAEMKRLISEESVQGLYLDGLSMDIRRARQQMLDARAAVGRQGWIYLHSSDTPYRHSGMRCPFLEGLSDLHLRGANGRSGLAKEPFLRFGVSGWNISGSPGFWCHYGSRGLPWPWDQAPGPRDIDAALGAHVRIWRRSHWRPAAIRRFDERYDAGLRRLAERESRFVSES